MFASLKICLFAFGSLVSARYKVYTATLLELADSNVSGEVTVFTRSDALLGVGKANGLEASLNATAAGGNSCTATNGCGAHVHSGTACTNGTTQGGHYFAGGNDPWLTVGYTSTEANGDGQFQFVVKDSAIDIAGKPFIVHNNAGGRVACGLLTEVTSGVTSATLTALGNSQVAAEVTIFATETEVKGAGHASNLEANISASNCTALNACGVHVHSGTACTDTTTQGGHYFSEASDPWLDKMYTSTDAAGDASFVFMVQTNSTDVQDKPFIVHNSAGGRVSCGLLSVPANIDVTPNGTQQETQNTTQNGGQNETQNGTQNGTQNEERNEAAIVNFAPSHGRALPFIFAVIFSWLSQYV